MKGARDFEAEKSSEALKKAFKGLGTDEKAIIHVISSHNNMQRQQIKKTYRTMYGKVMEKWVATNVRTILRIGVAAK